MPRTSEKSRAVNRPGSTRSAQGKDGRRPPNGSGVPVVGTGIPGLDDILDGGLPCRRLYLVEGVPGAGKTTLALQYLQEGRARGERGVYVTLSETRQELEEVAASHGWTLDGIDLLDVGSTLESASPEAQYTVFHPSEVELQATIDRLKEKVEEVRPTRIVLDSLSDMRLLSRDPLRFRRHVLGLKQFFAERDATVLLLDDETAQDSEMQLQSLAHGVLRLEHIALTHGAERRHLRIAKLRGVRFHAGYHDFTIRTGGIELFPRIRLGVEYPAPRSGTFRSGSVQLDRLLGGGIQIGTSVLLTGAPGTGKSVLATQYAAAAAARGERVAMYLFDERVGTFTERARGLEMNLEPYIASGHLVLNRLEPTEISPGEFNARVIHAVEEGATIVVVDSLNGFTKAMAEEKQVTIKVHELLSYLGARGVTTMLTLAQRGIFGAAPEDGADVSYLADAVVLLRYFESSGSVRRAISVFKQRSADHERTIREFRLGPGGLRLGDPLHDFHGVLTGVPTYTGGQGELMVSGGAGRLDESSAR